MAREEIKEEDDEENDPIMQLLQQNPNLRMSVTKSLRASLVKMTTPKKEKTEEIDPI